MREKLEREEPEYQKTQKVTFDTAAPGKDIFDKDTIEHNPTKEDVQKAQDAWVKHLKKRPKNQYAWMVKSDERKGSKSTKKIPAKTKTA